MSLFLFRVWNNSCQLNVYILLSDLLTTVLAKGAPKAGKETPDLTFSMPGARPTHFCDTKYHIMPLATPPLRWASGSVKSCLRSLYSCLSYLSQTKFHLVVKWYRRLVISIDTSTVCIFQLGYSLRGHYSLWLLPQLWTCHVCIVWFLLKLKCISIKDKHQFHSLLQNIL